MRRFARNSAPAAGRDLEEALHGRGAYRRFQDVIHQRGLQEEWDTFRAEKLASHVSFMLKECNIRFRK